MVDQADAWPLPTDLGHEFFRIVDGLHASVTALAQQRRQEIDEEGMSGRLSPRNSFHRPYRCSFWLAAPQPRPGTISMCSGGREVVSPAGARWSLASGPALLWSSG